jgi:hypothetical protein
MASTKARRASEPTELVELLRDNKPTECSLDRAASVALANLRQRARFVARKKSVGQERTFRKLRGAKVKIAAIY